MSEGTVQIQDLDARSVAVGDRIEQAGVGYVVVKIDEGLNGFGRRVDAIYAVWDSCITGKPDTYRTVVDSRGFAGQIRWFSPYGMGI